jgi:hypothetical protein
MHSDALPVSAGFFMHKTRILLVAFSLIAINAIVAVLLLLIPANDGRIPSEAKVPPVATIVATTTGMSVTEGVVTDTPPQHTPVVVERVGTSSSVTASGAHIPVSQTEIVHVNESRVRIPVLAEGTVLDAMRAYETVSDTFSYAGKEHPGIGFYVQEVNGTQEGEGYYWILYVNGKTADMGASKQKVTPRDVLEWRFQEGYNNS